MKLLRDKCKKYRSRYSKEGEIEYGIMKIIKMKLEQQYNIGGEWKGLEKDNEK